MLSGFIPNVFQNAIFGLLLFAPVALKKNRNRAGYSSIFSTPPAQKSSRPKPSLLKDIGYSRFACLGMLSLVSLHAQAEAFPRGCEVVGFGYNHNYLTINETGNQTIYFIQNRSNRTVQLQRQETRNVFMSPKLEANIAAGYWAAFASDEKNMYFKCSLKNEDLLTRVNCADVIDICQYPRAKFALSNMGNYWISTNKPRDMVIKEAVAKGVYLKW